MYETCTSCASTHRLRTKHQFHKNLRSFVLGDIEAQELHEKIDRESSKMNDKIELKQEKLYSILNILETYTEDQREQALDNLDQLEGQREDALENMKKGIPLRRIAETEEIFSAIKFIIECDYFTGRVIDVDGGLRLT